MKTKIIVSALVILLGLGGIGFYTPGDDKNVAIAIKVIHDVSKMTGGVDWVTAKKGDYLYSGDKVLTKARSIAIVKFNDNSMLRVRENTELKIFAELKDGKLQKNVDVRKGKFTFDIQKQENAVFTFSSPTSVAAIRGTAGDMGSTDDGDMITVLKGLVNLFNSLSQQSVNVGEGQTGISNKDGTIYVRDANQNEKDDAQNSLNASHDRGKMQELDLQLRDKGGNTKQLKIQYHGK